MSSFPRTAVFPLPAGGAGGLSNAAVEALIAAALLAYVKLTGTQTITGTKFFEPPAAPEGTHAEGEEGAEAIRVQAAAGESTKSKAAASIGGFGGQLPLHAGNGGNATASLTEATGGNGGAVNVGSGKGGAATTTGGALNIGGFGGTFLMAAGEGGEAGGTGAGTRAGGEGGEYKIAGGHGGTATTGTGARTGGNGGRLILEAGGGGEGTTKGGKGATAEIKGGAAGLGGTPTGGAVNITGGAASTEALSGAVNIATGTGAGTVRMTIAGTGGVTVVGSFAVWNHATPAAQPASIKPEEVTVKVAMERVDTVLKAYGLTA